MSEEEVITEPATSGNTSKSPGLGRKKSEGNLKLIYYYFFDDENYLTAILCTYFIMISLAVFSSMRR